MTSGQVLAILEAGEGAVAAKPAAAKPKRRLRAGCRRSEAAAAAAKLAPSAKRMVEEHKLDAGQIAGSGRDGRISKGDVIQHMAGKEAAPAKPRLRSRRRPSKLPAPAGARTEQRVPMTRLRARIAERLVQAQATAAMLTTFNEVDLTAVNEIRARYKDKFEKTHGVKLGFMSFFVKASIEALRRFPAVNASLDGNDVVYHEFYDIGVAVSTDRGLMVPVLRNAETMSFAEIEARGRRLTRRRRATARSRSKS